VIGHEPQRLLEVEGIGPKRAERITASWADQRVVREIMAFLSITMIRRKVLGAWLLRCGPKNV
jgi:hypothetical protein